MSEKLTRTQIKNLERLGGVNPADSRFRAGSSSPRWAATRLVTGGAVGAGLLLRDHWGMEGVKPPPPVRLKDYSVSLPPSRPAWSSSAPAPSAPRTMPPRKPSSRPAKSRRSRWSRSALDAMGGVGALHQQGDVVVIKPNVAFDKNPDLAATTQPDTVAAVTKLCLGAGARKVIVADNPINNPESCFYKTKVGEAAVRAGAELMLPKDSYFEQLYVGGETITHTWRMFYRPFREATKVIGISPVKDHNLCKATVTMKNWYGLLGNPRNQFHQNIHGIISDFALMMKPTLVIADGRKLLMRNGPTGGSLNDVKKGDTIVVGTDHTSVDSWCVTHCWTSRARDHLPRQGDPARPGPGLAAAVDAGDHGMSQEVQAKPKAGRRAVAENHQAGRPVQRPAADLRRGLLEALHGEPGPEVGAHGEGSRRDHVADERGTGNRNARLTTATGCSGRWLIERHRLSTPQRASDFPTEPPVPRMARGVHKERRKRLTTKEKEEKFAPLCPDFVIELRSRSDRKKERVHKKMREYMAQGTRLGWLIDPIEQTVDIYRPGRPVETLEKPATLSGEDVLPGFVLDLKGILFD